MGHEDQRLWLHRQPPLSRKTRDNPHFAAFSPSPMHQIAGCPGFPAGTLSAPGLRSGTFRKRNLGVTAKTGDNRDFAARRGAPMHQKASCPGFRGDCACAAPDGPPDQRLVAHFEPSEKAATVGMETGGARLSRNRLRDLVLVRFLPRAQPVSPMGGADGLGTSAYGN